MAIHRRSAPVASLNQGEAEINPCRSSPLGVSRRKRTLLGLALALVAPVLSLVPAALSAPGQLDLTFNTCEPGETAPCGGKSVRDVGDEDHARAIAIQADGKILIGGQRGPWAGGFAASIPTDFAVVRYNPDGTIDATFGNKGTVLTDFGGAERVTALAIQQDGKIVAGGTVSGHDPTEEPDTDFAIARYNPDGSTDVDFGLAGKVTTDWTYQENLSALVIQPDGRIVAAGPGARNSNDITMSRPGRQQEGPYSLALVRYETTGVLDSSFGGDGVVTSDAVGASREAFFEQGLELLSLVVQGKSFVLAGAGSKFRFGTCDVPCPLDFGLARLTPDGRLDTSFGSNGLAYDSVGPGSDQAMAVAVHDLSPENQGLIAAGVAQDCVGAPSACQSDFAVTRYSKNGLLDQSWGEGGKATVDFGGYDLANSVAVQADGAVVIAGTTCEEPWPNASPRGCNFALARYSPEGVLDGSFGNGGKVTTQILDDDAVDEVATGVAVQPDSRIIAVGAGPGDFLTAAYLDRLVDLGVTLVDTPDPVVKGDPLSYEVHVENFGQEAAENVVSTVTLAAPVKFESAVSGRGSCEFATPVLTCNLGRIDGNSSVSVAVKATAPSTLLELTTASNAFTTTFEINKANNQASAVTLVVDLPPIVRVGADPVVNGSGVTQGFSDKAIIPQSPGSAPGPPAPPAGSSLPAGAGTQGSAAQIPGPPPTSAVAPAPPVVQAGTTPVAGELPVTSFAPSASEALATPALGAYPLALDPQPAPRYLTVGRRLPSPQYALAALGFTGSLILVACAIHSRRRPLEQRIPCPSPALARI